MKATRREFMGYVGIVLGALLSTRCAPTCYTPVPTGPFPTSPPTAKPSWNVLQECWFTLDDPRLRSYEETEFSIDLRKRHTDALETLVSGRELSSEVAEEINIAFEQAVAHIQRQMASCYIALPPEFGPRDDLVERVTVLEEMAEESDVEVETVREMRAALERDMEWLAEFDAGKMPGEWEEVEVDSVSRQAARVLVDLLLGDFE